MRQLTDASGAVSLAKSYDPYGQLRNLAQRAGSPATPLGYTGEMTDLAANGAADGLVYLRARYYDASVGRFTSRDTWPGVVEMPQSLNRYTYGLDNPILNTDPNGHCGPLCVLALAAGIGAAAFGGLDIWQQLQQNGGNWGCIDWKEVAEFGITGAMLGIVIVAASAGLIPIPLAIASQAMVAADLMRGDHTNMMLDAALGLLPIGEAVEAFEGGVDAARAAEAFGPEWGIGDDLFGGHAFSGPGFHVGEYDPKGLVVGQEVGSSCVAAACRMLLNDANITETAIRDLLDGESRGNYIENAVDALREYGKQDYVHVSPITLPDLQKALEKGPVIVSVRPPGFDFNHAIVVDGIEGGSFQVRDPLPGQYESGDGSAYSIQIGKIWDYWDKSRGAIILK